MNALRLQVPSSKHIIIPLTTLKAHGIWNGEDSNM